jgi:hypothetical protein
MDNITIAVDTANSGSTTNETYSLVSPESGKSSWKLDGSALSDKDQMVIYATPPKRSGNFRGVVRGGVKFTHGVTVPGVNVDDSLESQIIVQITGSAPEGVDDADLVLVIQRAVAFACNNGLVLDVFKNATPYPSVS